MPLQGDNICVTGTLFFFGRSSLTVTGTACDTWRTYVYNGVEAGNRGGGGGSNLGRHRPYIPLGMVNGKSNWIDVSICTDNGYEKVGGCNGGRFKEVGGCTDGGFEEVRGCVDGGSEEVGVQTESKSKEIGGCTDDGSKEVGGCIDGRSEDVGGCIDGRSKEMGDYTNRDDKKVGGCNDADTNEMMGWQLIHLHLLWDVDQPRTSGSRATIN